MIRRVDARERIIVAIDQSHRDDILRTVEALSGSVGWVKLGLQAFVSNGPQLVRDVVGAGHRVFLDLKFHDIPNTASNAVAEAAKLGVAMTNVHAAGGRAMLETCAALKGSALLIGVTVLTSLGDSDLDEIGFAGDSQTNVVRLATLSRDCGLDGVVASPREITAIREACGESFLIVTPGIRPADAAADDQKRTMTPRAAVDAGATHIVIGRPITSAPDPRAAALRIAESIATRQD